MRATLPRLKMSTGCGISIICTVPTAMQGLRRTVVPSAGFCRNSGRLLGTSLIKHSKRRRSPSKTQIS